MDDWQQTRPTWEVQEEEVLMERRGRLKSRKCIKSEDFIWECCGIDIANCGAQVVVMSFNFHETP